MSYNMAFFLGELHTDAAWGRLVCFLTGLAAIFIAIALFEKKSWRYIFINGAYSIIYFTVIGFIIGIWR